MSEEKGCPKCHSEFGHKEGCDVIDPDNGIRPESVSGEPPRAEPPMEYCKFCGQHHKTADHHSIPGPHPKPLYNECCGTRTEIHGERGPHKSDCEAGSRPSAPAREGLCEDCGNEYPTPWFVSNDIWNQVVELSADPKNFLCMHCFVKRADKVIRCTGWEIVPENSPSAPEPSTVPDEFDETPESVYGPEPSLEYRKGWNAALRELTGSRPCFPNQHDPNKTFMQHTGEILGEADLQQEAEKIVDIVVTEFNNFDGYDRAVQRVAAHLRGK